MMNRVGGPYKAKKRREPSTLPARRPFGALVPPLAREQASKAKKRDGAPIKAESEKKPKVENEVNEEGNDIDADVNGEDSKPLYDFAGDKMGPKKGKGRGAGKRGRPRGALKSIGRGGEGLKKGSNNHEAENGHSLLDEDSLGFLTQT